MCGRYVSPDEAAFTSYLRQLPQHNLRRTLLALSPKFNVAPTTEVAVLRRSGDDWELIGMRWGLIPYFAKGVPGPHSTTNARIERLRVSPAYRGAWNTGKRCLILAQGFYEWQLVAGGKQPWYISCADQPVFGFAGLWDSSTPEGSIPILSCTIVTLPASPMMAQIHNSKQREPAIVQAADTAAWLGENADEAFACLKPYPDDLRKARPVSTRVNSPGNDGPELIKPLAA